MTVRGNQPVYCPVPLPQLTVAERRSKLIQERLDGLELASKQIVADQRWPTQKEIEKHSFRQRVNIPKVVITPPSPFDSDGFHWIYTRNGYREPMKATAAEIERYGFFESPINPRAEFPYGISTGATETKNLSLLESTFIYFQFLPVEIRLAIWEMELLSPKFIEAQFCAGFFSPTFVGSCTRRPPLLWVNREAREVALREEYGFLKPIRTDIDRRSIQSMSQSDAIAPGDTWGDIGASGSEEPAKSVSYVAERDTIFFRPLNGRRSGIRCLTLNVSGFRNIQHLALPLPANGFTLRSEWNERLSEFRDLKTLTLMVGGRDQSWFGHDEIELRGTKEWYADGRDRTVNCDKRLWDVDEIVLELWLGGSIHEAQKGVMALSKRHMLIYNIMLRRTGSLDLSSLPWRVVQSLPGAEILLGIINLNLVNTFGQKER
ncbi:hypothetical protein BJ878DRAFT_476376 [Calycina marina]|uniref:2EXR domain-containing protein n=1 Tax=Calycina marina TaxID=1763456 RepID=A0A9P8CIL5_9HELO|nr:hypothetical protein BJ878DRAFT_476376 [Calycina marina]